MGSLVVQKYGGTSLATPKHINRAALRIKSVREQGYDVVVVVSAMGRMTDHLISLAQKTVSRPPQRELDMLMTAGERISMSLLAMSLEQLGVKAISFTGSQSGIITSSDHTEARILSIRADRIVTALEGAKVVIIAGFQGVSLAREVTTLGRGGSDTTAIALAAELNAQRCEILTDVDGLFTADPRLVPDARMIKYCSYEEALELARLGAKMHPRSVEVARKFRVPLCIRSSFNSECEGTVVMHSHHEPIEQVVVRGVATSSGYGLIDVRATPTQLLSICVGQGISVKYLAVSGQRTNCVIASGSLAVLRKTLQQMELDHSIVDSVSLLSIVGEGLAEAIEQLASFCSILDRMDVPLLCLSNNALSITAVIPTEFLVAAVRNVHGALVGASDCSHSAVDTSYADRIHG